MAGVGEMGMHGEVTLSRGLWEQGEHGADKEKLDHGEDGGVTVNVGDVRGVQGDASGGVWW